jgi:hypothetical protein
MNNTIVTSFVFGCFILASGGDESNNCISNCFSVSSSNVGCDPERSFFALLPSMLILFVSESDLENTKKQTKIGIVVHFSFFENYSSRIKKKKCDRF